jgi:hypothetical protein
VEAAVDVLFASADGLGEELSRNGRLFRRGLDWNCARIFGYLEARLGGVFLEVVLQALFSGAGSSLRVR